MGKANKKEVRRQFRIDCLGRDNIRCRVCGLALPPYKLEVHHITNRNEMPGGGYVKENGITLCTDCHLRAEYVLNKNIVDSIYRPENLYNIIGSSKQLAIEASKKKFSIPG